MEAITVSQGVFTGSKDDPLRGPRLKINRAKDKIDGIETEIRDYFEANAICLVIEKDAITGDRMAKIKLSTRIPDSLYLNIAEAVYHMRSSLDQLIVSIAVKSGIPNVKHLYFPFGESLSNLEQATRREHGKKGKLFGLPIDVQEAVLALEPYRDGQVELWALGRLSNIDKHIKLVPVGSLGMGKLFQNLDILDAKVGIMITGPGDLEEGLTISNLGSSGRILNKEGQQPTVGFQGSNANVEVTADLNFGDVDVFKGQPVVPILRSLHDLTESIVRIFADQFFDA